MKTQKCPRVNQLGLKVAYGYFLFRTFIQMRIVKNFCSELIPCTSVFSLVVLLEAAFIQILEVRLNGKPKQQETIFLQK